MKRAFLRMNVKSVTVLWNGDPHDAKPPKGERNNAIIATLEYPRPGAPKVVSTKPLDLQSGIPFDKFDTNDFWDSGLFKEEIVDETKLRIQITDRDDKSKFLRVLRTILAALVGVRLGATAEGISNVYAGAIANLAIEQGVGVITPSKGGERIHIIGEVDQVLLATDSFTDNTLILPLKTPKEIKKQGKDALKPGEDNGVIVLKVSIEQS